MASAAANKWRNWTFGLYASNESNRTAFKRFHPSPTITVEYNSVPTIAAGSTKTSPATACTTTPPFPVIGDTSVTLYATPQDADAGAVDVQFTLTNDRTGEALFPTKSVPGSSGRVHPLPAVPAAAFTDNTSYTWRARAWDGKDSSAWTACRFTIDKSKPGAPEIVSPDYPDGGSIPTPARTASTFNLTPQASATGDDIPACYVYALSIKPSTIATCQAVPVGAAKVTADATGRAQITLTPRRVGANTLYAFALDKAGNQSDTAEYEFTTGSLINPDPAGDFTGDGKPDLLGVGTTAHAGLWLHTGTGDGHLGTSSQVGAAGTGEQTTGSPADWIGAVTTRADFNGDGAQDLLARTAATKVAVYLGGGDGSPLRPDDEYRQEINLPGTDAADDPSRIDQIVAADDANMDGTSSPDLIAVIDDRLWLYPATAQWRTYEAPILLGDSGWSTKTIAAAVVNGTSALWIRDKTSGRLDLYQAATNAPPGSPASIKTTVATTGWTDTAKPFVAGQDVNTDGVPDLWAVAPANNGTISAYLATSPTTFGSPVAGTGGWLTSFTSLS